MVCVAQIQGCAKKKRTIVPSKKRWSFCEAKVQLFAGTIEAFSSTTAVFGYAQPVVSTIKAQLRWALLCLLRAIFLTEYGEIKKFPRRSRVKEISFFTVLRKKFVDIGRLLTALAVRRRPISIVRRLCVLCGAQRSWARIIRTIAVATEAQPNSQKASGFLRNLFGLRPPGTWSAAFAEQKCAPGAAVGKCPQKGPPAPFAGIWSRHRVIGPKRALRALLGPITRRGPL